MTERDDLDDLLFQGFMSSVEGALMRLCGMTSFDLSDYNYRDAFKDDMLPSEVAQEVYDLNCE